VILKELKWDRSTL